MNIPGSTLLIRDGSSLRWGPEPLLFVSSPIICMMYLVVSCAAMAGR